MAKNLVRQFENCNCPVAAFNVTNTLRDGVYKKATMAALDLFYRAPCPETAALLATHMPQSGPIIAQTTGAALHLGSPESRGRALRGIDEYVAEVEETLEHIEAIWQFVHTVAIERSIPIGFHNLRDQGVLVERMEILGLRKPWLRSTRKWLRHKVTRRFSAWRICLDLICIHGVVRGSEVFWNGLGGEEDEQWYLRSEILYNLGEGAVDFEDRFRKPVNTVPRAETGALKEPQSRMIAELSKAYAEELQHAKRLLRSARNESDKMLAEDVVLVWQRTVDSLGDVRSEQDLRSAVAQIQALRSRSLAAPASMTASDLVEELRRVLGDVYINEGTVPHSVAEAVSFLESSIPEDAKSKIRADFLRGNESSLRSSMKLGMSVRNTLRTAGFTEQSLGVENLDDVWIDLLREAVGAGAADV